MNTSAATMVCDTSMDNKNGQIGLFVASVTKVLRHKFQNTRSPLEFPHSMLRRKKPVMKEQKWTADLTTLRASTLIRGGQQGTREQCVRFPHVVSLV